MSGETTAKEQLIGAWQLISWQIYGEGNMPATEPFGPQPMGLLQYTSDDWMSAAICKALRPSHPAGISPRRMDPDLLVSSYRSYFHYAGHWRVEGDHVIHSIVLSLNPNMVGSEQVRHMTFATQTSTPVATQTLTLTGIEALGQQQRRHVLLWQRASKPDLNPANKPASKPEITTE